MSARAAPRPKLQRIVLEGGAHSKTPGRDFAESIFGNEFSHGVGVSKSQRCLLEWKTTFSRYPEELVGFLMLDPQLVCYPELPA
jgi:hypothetical protein